MNIEYSFCFFRVIHFHSWSVEEPFNYPYPVQNLAQLFCYGKIRLKNSLKNKPLENILTCVLQSKKGIGISDQNLIKYDRYTSPVVSVLTFKAQEPHRKSVGLILDI